MGIWKRECKGKRGGEREKGEREGREGERERQHALELRRIFFSITNLLPHKTDLEQQLVLPY